MKENLLYGNRLTQFLIVNDKRVWVTEWASEYANVCTLGGTVLVKRHFETFRAEQIRQLYVCIFFIRINRIRNTIHVYCVCEGTVLSSYTLNYYDCERSKNELLDRIWLCIDACVRRVSMPSLYRCFSTKSKAKRWQPSTQQYDNTNNNRNNQEETYFQPWDNDKGFIISSRTTRASVCCEWQAKSTNYNGNRTAKWKSYTLFCSVL